MTSVTRLSTALERLPSLATARRTMGGWGEGGVRVMKRHPVRAAVGAFALGVALTTVAHRL